MSEHITHLAICDDTFRLAQHHAAIPDLFKRLMAERRDIAHLGATTRQADTWSAKILAAARDELDKPAGDRDPWAEDKIIFVLGALTHRAADRLMKPIIRRWDKSQPERKESTIYMDIHSFREVYGNGTGERRGPFDPAVVQKPGEAAAAFQHVLTVAMRRLLINMHTFAPDSANADQWLGTFLEKANQQNFGLDLGIYERAAAEWDPAKVKLYLEEGHFYDPADPTIDAARRIQRGETLTHAQIDSALDRTTDEHSRYARALAKAMEYLLAATELFHRDIGEDDARGRFDVGVPELALKFDPKSHGS